MAPLALVIRVLVSLSLVFSVIELGISAYLVNESRQLLPFVEDTSDGIIDRGYIRIQTPAQISFLTFVSVWSILACIALIAARRFNRNDKVFGMGILGLTALTMIFWLSGFAAFVAMFGGYAVFTGIFSAYVAFSVLPWLTFLALTVINSLTAFGVLRTERPGYGAIFNHHQQHSTFAVRDPAPREVTEVDQSAANKV